MLDHAPSPIEDAASANTATTIHPIRTAEDALFQEWLDAHPKRHPFATDGCADPSLFEKSRYRILLVLKERNWGHTVEEQRAFAEEQIDPSIRLTKLREDTGRETFDGWWTPMAQWVEVLLAKDLVDWSAIQSHFEPEPSMTNDEKERWIHTKNKAALGKCACVQLKKAPGGGTMNKADFNAIVSEDKDLILRQFAIYSPHFIVSCGSGDNWNLFVNTIFPKSEVKRTRNGIQYFIASSTVNGLCKTAVVNFGHPSMRVNSSLWGVLAFGLREALDEIFSLCPDLRELPA